jgi:hypothetical protein
MVSWPGGPERASSGSGLLAIWLAASAVLTGCTGGPGSVQASVSTAVQDSSSAVATARLALGLEGAAKMTRAATSTTLDDALKELQTARNAVLRLSPTMQKDRDIRGEALSVLDGSISGVTTAREALSSEDGNPSRQDGEALLGSAADQLSALNTRLGGT